MRTVPRYADLPISPDAPEGSSWGVFGRDDQLGTLNFITPEARARAATLVKQGKSFNLDLPLHMPYKPFFLARKRPTHTIARWANGTVQDDWLDGFYPQYSSQWDSLRHIKDPDVGFYNWTSDDDAAAPDGKLGIDKNAKAGIVGRGVLLDVQRFLKSQGEDLQPDQPRPIEASTLEATATAQNVEIQPGDILMLRTGMASMLHQEAANGEQTEPREGFACPGIAQGEASLAWLWDHQIAAVVADNLAVEATPFNRELRTLHRWGIVRLGLILGELFDFEDLAQDCAQDHIYESLFVAKPLLLRGGVGSPANALALK